MIEIKHLSKTFQMKDGAVNALKDISLTIPDGSIYGIIGMSGAGKSTLFNAIAGEFLCDGGKIVLDGKNITYQKEYIRAKDIGRLFQDPMRGTAPDLTLEENVALAYARAGGHLFAPALPRKKRAFFREQFARLDMGLEDRMTSKVGLLSGGQRQRVGIARALIMNPKLIIADECISALDVSIQAQVVNLMKDIQQETGTAYLFIAHDLSMVKYISDRIGVLHLGHLLETGTTEEIFEHPIHPYTRSLLSAIPLPNPVVEKRRVAETYDYAASGIDYSLGTSHHVAGSHYVKCTDAEFAQWCR